jgi:hypothetical protein
VLEVVDVLVEVVVVVAPTGKVALPEGSALTHEVAITARTTLHHAHRTTPQNVTVSLGEPRRDGGASRLVHSRSVEGEPQAEGREMDSNRPRPRRLRFGAGNPFIEDAASRDHQAWCSGPGSVAVAAIVGELAEIHRSQIIDRNWIELAPDAVAGADVERQLALGRTLDVIESRYGSTVSANQRRQLSALGTWAGHQLMDAALTSSWLTTYHRWRTAAIAEAGRHPHAWEQSLVVDATLALTATVDECEAAVFDLGRADALDDPSSAALARLGLFTLQVKEQPEVAQRQAETWLAESEWSERSSFFVLAISFHLMELVLEAGDLDRADALVQYWFPLALEAADTEPNSPWLTHVWVEGEVR